MGEPSLGSVVDERSDVELAAVFERIWQARGYETRVRFSGPDVHVDAEGETPAGARREVRVWITTNRRVTADMVSGFARACDRADVEPYLAVVGRARLADDAHRPGVVEYDAHAIAVEVREAGLEDFVRDFARAGDEKTRQTNWLGDPVESDETDGDGDEGEDGDDAEPEWLSRREALKRAGGYVVGGLVTYLVVERVSDAVQRSPRLRAAVASRVAWVEGHLPDVSLPTVEWSMPTADPLYDPAATPAGDERGASRPANATTVPYEDLRADTASYAGTAVTYSGRVDRTTERGGTRLALLSVADERGRPRGDVVVRWPAGRFFEDEVGFRLLDGERVTVWGFVAGERSWSGEATYPLVDVTALERA